MRSIGIRPAYDACIDRAGGATWTMQECIVEEGAYQDARIDAAERKLRPLLTDAEWQAYLARKDAFHRERWNKCPWDAQNEGQTHRIAANDCALKELARWATELEQSAR